MKTATRSTTLLIGRIFISLIFLMSGVHKITNFGGTVDQIADKGLPMASVLAAGAILFELAGGLSLVTGYKSKYGAFLLVLFLIPTTFLFHNFWAFEGQEMQKQMINFMKNLSILGGLLVLTVTHPGSFSFAKKEGA